MTSLELNGDNLTAELIYQIAESWQEPQNFCVQISSSAVQRVGRASQAVADFLKNEEIIYGITTGFGDFKSKLIPIDKVKELQKNILLSHATGVGSFLPHATVRAMMAARVQTFLKGNSGIRLEVIQTLVDMINKGVYPLVPEKGSLGASGDLAPLAHMALVLIGEGHAWYQGEVCTGAEAMQRAGISLIELEAKEGLALTNGTSLITTVGALAVYKAEQLALVADLASALSIEALRGTPLAFDPRIHAVRPHAGQARSAANILRLLAGSQLTREFDPPGCTGPIQSALFAAGARGSPGCDCLCQKLSRN